MLYKQKAKRHYLNNQLSKLKCPSDHLPSWHLHIDLCKDNTCCFLCHSHNRQSDDRMAFSGREGRPPWSQHPHASRCLACTRATLRNSLAWVSGHCISLQLIGTITAPGEQEPLIVHVCHFIATLCSS